MELEKNAAVCIKDLPVFTPNTIPDIVGFDWKDLSKDIKVSGVYRVLSGSRGCLEEVEFIGDLNTETIYVPSKEDVLASFYGDSEEEMEENREYVEEWYLLDEECGCISFSYTEEENDTYFKVEI